MTNWNSLHFWALKLTTTTNEMKKIHNNIAHSLIKPCARNGFANCLSNLVICTIGKPIVQPIIQINNIFICSNGLPVHSTLSVLLIRLNGYKNHLSNLFISMISEPIAQPVVQINNIFIRSNSLPVCSTLSVLLICSNGWPNHSNNLFTHSNS